MSRPVGILVGLGLVLGCLPGCSQPAIPVAGICACEAIPGVPGADRPAPTAIAGIKMVARQLPDGVRDEKTDPHGHFTFHLPPGRYLFTPSDEAVRLLSRSGQAVEVDAAKPVEAEVAPIKANTVRLMFRRFDA